MPPRNSTASSNTADATAADTTAPVASAATASAASTASATTATAPTGSDSASAAPSPAASATPANGAVAPGAAAPRPTYYAQISVIHDGTHIKKGEELPASVRQDSIDQLLAEKAIALTPPGETKLERPDDKK